MVPMLLIIVLLVIIENEFRPRLGWTTEKKLLLWYGRKQRKFIVVF